MNDIQPVSGTIPPVANEHENAIARDPGRATVTHLEIRGGTVRNPPSRRELFGQARPGDFWLPEDSPRLRMNDDHEWVLA